MSLTINRFDSGVGISERNAILIVHIPTGSTVTASKGSVILLPKTWVSGSTVDEDIAMFIFLPGQFDSINPWMITVTDGTNTASTTVPITSNKEYDVELSCNVPAEYQEVEFIQSSGNQYIDTSIDVGSNFRISTTIWLTQTSSAENPLFSIWISSENYWNLFMRANTQCFDLYVNGHNDLQTLALNRKYAFTLERDGSYWISTLDSDAITRIISSGDTNATPLKFLARGDGAGPSYWKLGPTKVYKNGELVGDFYPCYRLSDSVAGMWDKVSESFFQNAGSGSFIVGPDVN